MILVQDMVRLLSLNVHSQSKRSVYLYSLTIYLFNQTTLDGLAGVSRYTEVARYCGSVSAVDILNVNLVSLTCERVPAKGEVHLTIGFDKITTLQMLAHRKFHYNFRIVRRLDHSALQYILVSANQKYTMRVLVPSPYTR